MRTLRSIFMVLPLLFLVTIGGKLYAASASRSLLPRAIAPIKSFASANPGLTKIAGMWALVGTGYLLYKWWWNRKYRDTFYCGLFVDALAVLPNGRLVTANKKAYGILEPWDPKERITVKVWDVPRQKCLQSFDLVSPPGVWSVQSITPLSNERIAIRFSRERCIYIIDMQNKLVRPMPYPPAPKASVHGKLEDRELLRLEVKGVGGQSYLIAHNDSASYRWDTQSNSWVEAEGFEHEESQKITFGNTTARNRWNHIEIKDGFFPLRTIRTKAGPMLMAALPDGRLASVEYAGSLGRASTGLVQIWDIHNGICEQEIPCGFPVTSMTGLPDGNVAVAGSRFEAGAKILRVAPRQYGARSTPPDSLHPMNLV